MIDPQCLLLPPSIHATTAPPASSTAHGSRCGCLIPQIYTLPGQHFDRVSFHAYLHGQIVIQFIVPPETSDHVIPSNVIPSCHLLGRRRRRFQRRGIVRAYHDVHHALLGRVGLFELGDGRALLLLAHLPLGDLWLLGRRLLYRQRKAKRRRGGYWS